VKRSRRRQSRFRAVQLLVFTVVALCALVTGYAIGLGGAVSTIAFLGILFVGVVIRVWEPLLERLRP
jgi:hypothetical protein